MASRRAPSRRSSTPGRPGPGRTPLAIGAAAIATVLVGTMWLPGQLWPEREPRSTSSVVAPLPSSGLGSEEERPVSRSAPRPGAATDEAEPEAGPDTESEDEVDDDEVDEAFDRLRERREREAEQARRAQKKLRKAAAKKVSTFRVGTFNILGSQHTRGSSRFEPGPVRAGVTAGLITSRGVDIVGMQEVQVDQLPPLLSGLAGYSVWPQQTLGRNSQRLQIAWRDSRFEVVEKRTSRYVFTSQEIPLPMVLLRDRATGAEFWVMTVHNSAGSMEDQRDRATDHQIGLIRGLLAETGKPVIVTGDVNEHEEFYQRVCAATGFAGANGGGGPSCLLPPRPLRVDWIMGGGGGGVAFSGYVQDGASLERASDHYFIHAGVTVTDSGGTS